MIAYNHNGITHILLPVPDCGLTMSEIIAKDVPGNATDITALDDTSVLPSDRVFRNAWRISGTSIVEDLAASKLIAHDLRRARRAIEFAPWDVKVTIPAYAAQAEMERQLIRNHYARIQEAIDASTDTDTLRSIVAVFQGS